MEPMATAALTSECPLIPRSCEKISRCPSTCSGRTAKYSNFHMPHLFVARLSNHERIFSQLLLSKGGDTVAKGEIQWGFWIPASAGIFIIICDHPWTTKAGPKGEAGGRRRRAVQVLPGPDPWNKQRTGWQGGH